MAETGPAQTVAAFSSAPAHRRLHLEWILLVIGSTALVAALILTGATARLDDAIYDVSLRFRQRPAPSDIVIVAIDFQSTARKGEWAWPRQLQGELLRNVARDHPRAIGFDVLLNDPGEPRGDHTLAASMRLAPVFLPTVLGEPSLGRDRDMVGPAPLFAAAATGLGRGEPTPDVDGIVRRAALYAPYKGVMLPSSIRLMADRIGGPPGGSGSRPGRDDGLIPYAGPAGVFPRVSAADVVDGLVPGGAFTGKYVLIGATAREMLDNYPTPVTGSEGMSNVEIDANILDGVLRHRMIWATPVPVTLGLSVFVVWLLAVGILLLKPGQLIIQAAVAAVICLAGTVVALVVGGVWFPPVSVIITGALFQLVWSARRLQAASDYFAEELAELQTRAGGAILATAPGRRLPVGDSVSRQMMLIDETKQRMRNLRRFVNDVLANFPDPVLVVNARGRILMCNQAAITLGERMGRPVMVDAEILPLLEDLETAAGEGRKLWPPPGDPESPRGVGPGGRVLEARYAATGRADGAPLGWILQLVDVTVLVSALRQREEALKLFSHDMRAPQSAILAALANEAFQQIPAPLRASIEKNALRTITLADGFMRLANAESSDYIFEPIDLYHALGDAADALWPIAQAAGVDLAVCEPGREFVVSADRALLFLALTNLIDNALKVSEPGASVDCILAPVNLRGRPAVALGVTDYASGKTVTHQKTLFKRFARTKTSGGGATRFDTAGLGLAVVHTIVTRHGGIIACDSRAEGTTFTVTLPLVEGPA